MMLLLVEPAVEIVPPSTVVTLVYDNSVLLSNVTGPAVTVLDDVLAHMSEPAEEYLTVRLPLVKLVHVPAKVFAGT